ncbi:MAG: shikimate dehydrogenase [Candidatus Omnitrophica bacterium]|nr:shikimate dehydrogenase [Candidatus Omnitrophota bacterium]MCM8817729.1 shikimate dehydrogenase [Candidatus Omnitrophota bacterium]
MMINGETIITGVFGYPVKHSLSPVFQNAAFKFYDLNWIYVPFEVCPDNLRAAIEAIRVFSIKGVNITIPHKKEAVKYLDFCDEEVQVLGVCNTIVNDRGILKGYSTDGPGFLRSLKEDGKFLPEKKRVFLFGAGGSAYAIAGTLVRVGISEIMICNRTIEKALQLKDHLLRHFGFRDIRVVPFEDRNDSGIWKNVDIVINTTSVGMKCDDIVLVDKKNLREDIFVYDIVYNRETILISYAKERKLKFLDGLSMLVFQGAVSFKLWTGLDAPIETMKKALVDFKSRGYEDSSGRI